MIPAEKRGPQKPQRFSTFLPDSQELLEIRTKKKVGLVRAGPRFPPPTTLTRHGLAVPAQLLIAGTEQFNQKPKKGIQFLQEKGLLSSPTDNNQIAQWLRENPRLDKKMIGEYISDRKNAELLDSFVK